MTAHRLKVDSHAEHRIDLSARLMDLEEILGGKPHVDEPFELRIVAQTAQRPLRDTSGGAIQGFPFRIGHAGGPGPLQTMRFPQRMDLGQLVLSELFQFIKALALAAEPVARARLRRILTGRIADPPELGEEHQGPRPEHQLVERIANFAHRSEEHTSELQSP